MPIYTYRNPKTKEEKDIVQTMKEEHVYSENGIQWERVFAAPNASIDTENTLDPFDKQEFIKYTAKKGMQIGDMWDASKHMSEKREAKVGKDFVKVNAENEYKHRTGKDHPLKEKPKTKFVDIK